MNNQLYQVWYVMTMLYIYLLKLDAFLAVSVHIRFSGNWTKLSKRSGKLKLNTSDTILIEDCFENDLFRNKNKFCQFENNDRSFSCLGFPWQMGCDHLGIIRFPTRYIIVFIHIVSPNAIHPRLFTGWIWEALVWMVRNNHSHLSQTSTRQDTMFQFLGKV